MFLVYEKFSHAFIKNRENRKIEILRKISKKRKINRIHGFLFIRNLGPGIALQFLKILPCPFESLKVS